MKKIICLLAVVLMIASIAYAAGKSITAKDLPALKGIWTGIISFGVTEAGGTSPVTLEILNDAVPVKAKLTVENIPDQVGKMFGIMSGKNVFENDAGLITSQGTIMWAGSAGNFMELTQGEKKVNLSYFFRGMKGSGTLKKK